MIARLLFEEYRSLPAVFKSPPSVGDESKDMSVPPAEPVYPTYEALKNELRLAIIYNLYIDIFNCIYLFYYTGSVGHVILKGKPSCDGISRSAWR